MAQETGKLIAWRKKEGEVVSKGEPLLDVETDKAVVEIEAPADGVLVGIKIHEGATVPVGQTIAWIVRPGEVPPPETSSDAVSSPATSLARPASPARTHEAPAGPSAKISPKARRLAKEQGVDISSLQGTGSGGEILSADIQAAAETQKSAGIQASTVETPSPIGRLMAERTTQSWTSVPHFFVVREVDATALLAAREKLGPEIEKARGVKPTHTDFLVALVARVLAKHPRMNATWSNEVIRLNQQVNVAIAMALEDGVVAAVIPEAGRMGLGEIAVRRREMTGRAKAGRLQPSDISGATFTISNLGMYDVDAFTAIIVPPQAAILAVGRIADRVVAIDRQPAIRAMMTLTLSSDHRVVDGARAAAFLNDVAEAIGSPEKWLG